MPSRTPREATAVYVTSVRRILSCIADAVLIDATGIDSPIWPRRLFVPGGPVRLEMQDSAVPRIALDFQHGYQAVRQPSGNGWRIETTAYIYSFRLERGAEILAYHWHGEPDAHVAYPHVHLKQGSGITFPPLQKAHLPTGLVTPADIVLLAHDGLGVAWIRDDWNTRLDTPGG